MHAWHDRSRGEAMRLERRLLRLLRKRGVRPNEALRLAVRDFVATVSEQNPEVIDAEAGEEDEDGPHGEQALQHFISCPHCGETIPIAIDLSGDEQDDVQDCTVCCSPIHVTYSVRSGQLHGFSSEPC
jgi:Cysteine-rich CPXCG